MHALPTLTRKYAHDERDEHDGHDEQDCADAMPPYGKKTALWGLDKVSPPSNPIRKSFTLALH